MKEAKEFAESIAAIFIETSARNAINVEELFQKISECLPATSGLKRFTECEQTQFTCKS